jgi:tRNA A37 threonylcarbamoyladenosine biosynthesis protein TsaE
LNDAREIDDLGLEELGLNSVLAIEWAEKLPRPIADAIEVRIDHGHGDIRTITLSGSSALPS